MESMVILSSILYLQLKPNPPAIIYYQKMDVLEELMLLK